MNPEQQIEAIQNMARRRAPGWLMWMLAMFSGLLLLVGLYTRDAPYFIGFALLALVAYSAHKTTPHINAAARAITNGERNAAVIYVEIARWSDSDTYYVSVPAKEGGRWRFEFIPLGWQPTAGEHRATVYRLPGLEWPVLVSIKEGVMYPRCTPSKEA
jgi:hypothetical protein